MFPSQRILKMRHRGALLFRSGVKGEELEMKLRTPSFIAIALVTFFFSGCIELDKTLIEPIDYKAEARFINLSSLGSATVKLTDVGASFGSLGAGEASTYEEIDAGSRTLEIQFSDSGVDTTLQMVFVTEKKGTVFMLGDTSSGLKLANVQERYTFGDPTKADTVLVRVLNGSVAFADLSVSASGTSSSFSAAASYGSASSYSAVLPGEYAFDIAVSDSTVMTDTLTLSGSARYTVAIYSQVKVFQDD
jgi:hypothetical protein